MATEEPKAPKSVWPQFSLRGLLVLVAIVAGACAALVKANSFVSPCVALATLALLFGGVVGGVVCRGYRQAFWIGFAIFGLGYLYIVFRGPRFEFDLSNTANAYLYQLWMIVPKDDVPRTFNGQYFTTQSPELEHFVRVGHYLSALLFAYLGGLLARYFYSTRTREA